MARPLVALVGRPNVGKSTLFNRIVGRRLAIVDPTAGLTRDRLYAVARWADREFVVIDTAGLDGGAGGIPPDDPQRRLLASSLAQSRAAIEEADVIVFMVDGRAGLLPLDRDIAQQLRRSRRPVVVVANKVDQHRRELFQHEVLELGFDRPVVISAQHGLGVGELLDRIVELFPTVDQDSLDEPEVARLAIMGRPNVGKSSLLNAIFGDERSVVSEIPGTTRDPVDTTLLYDGLPVVLVDTAGIRRNRAARDRLEHYSLLRGIGALERADAVILVLDAVEGVLSQDQHIASYALEAGRGLVLVVNKVDLAEPKMRTAAAWRDLLVREFKFFPHAPVLAVSATRRTGLERVLPTALEVVEQRRLRVPTNELNRYLREIVVHRPPPSFQGRRLEIKFATQAGGETPTIVLFVNDTDLLHFSYRRYLENRLRERFGFQGNPLRLVLRSFREGPEGVTGSTGHR